jgi:DNA-directed RNA polymerase II subunit RPB2
MTDTNYIEEPWKLINSYFEGKHLNRMVRHQLESYNDFVNYQIYKTINMFNSVVIHSEKSFNKELNKYTLEIIIDFDNFSVHKPQTYENNGSTDIMFPKNGRIRNFTYSSTMTLNVNMQIIRRTGDNLENVSIEKKVLNNIHIGKLPIMLKSDICVLNQYKHIKNSNMGECKYDAGGYFIINGSEKTVLAQERAAENRIYCFKVKKKPDKYLYTAEIKSVPDFKIISPKQVSMMICKKDNGFGNPIHITLARIRNPIPLFVLFRAIGIISDKDICSYILLDLNDRTQKKYLSALEASVVDANEYLTQEDAIQLIMKNINYVPINMTPEEGIKKKYEHTQEILENDLFPHCHNLTQKKYYLGYMVQKLLKCYVGDKQSDDRDNYINKRIDLVGILLNNLFRNYFNKLVTDMKKYVIKEINTGSWKSTDDYLNIINRTNISNIIKSTHIENGLKKALSTGDFSIKNSSNSSAKVGVAQVLNRLTYISSLSHLRRINTPIDKKGNLIPPRKLHNSSWGYICPAETPEGASVGVVKNISYMAHITIPSYSENLYEIVSKDVIILSDCKHDELFNKVKVIINGCWIGITDNPIKLFADLKNKKYSGIINIYTSVLFDYNNMEIRICSDAGRLTRPLLKVKNKKTLITKNVFKLLDAEDINWSDMLINHKFKQSLIEYIDPEEQNYILIANKPLEINNNQSTHCEIHPSTIFGILASCIPFPEHNQAPRNTYQCAMGKQAMGMYVTNFRERMDKTAYVLTYAMRPLVDTRIMNMLQMNKIPSGEMVVVAIASYTGYNQEDSLIFNKGSLDRGLFSATIYHTEKDEDKRIHGDSEIRCKPDKFKTKGLKFANYEKLNSNGLMKKDQLVENGDIIIGKVSNIKDNKNDMTKRIKFKDESRMYRTNEESYIDKNIIGRNGDGYSFCKVRIRTTRKPVIGDKFSSRHGQKGTIGIILPEEDMPFTAQGIKPDLIINPHAIPSRMTIGQLKETLLGKVLIELGLYGDGTSFGEMPISDISKELQKCGYESNGNELLINGMTGEQLESSIFIGTAFYQRLKHMVNDKYHSRSFGPMVNHTRQPAEGRARDGGLRYGEMERDCMISHGASSFNKERIYDVSDKYQVHVCKDCGMIAAFNAKKQIHICNNCDNTTNFALVKIPYAFKLMMQELITMNVVPRILTE